MKKSLLITILFAFISTAGFSQLIFEDPGDDPGGGGPGACLYSLQYNGSTTSSLNPAQVSSSAQTIRFNIVPSGICGIENFSFSTGTSWMIVAGSGTNYVDISVSQNTSGLVRSGGFQGTSFSGIRIRGYIQQAGNGCTTVNYYPDTDGDGWGDFNAFPIASCSPILGMVTNNSDQCPLDPNPLSLDGCPLSQTENINWLQEDGFDVFGNLISSSRSYYNALGNGIQTQTYDFESQRMWAVQTMYDYQSRPALQSLSAPITATGTPLSFLYNPDFIKRSNNVSNFNISDFETANILSPSVVGNLSNTLGWYYSSLNNEDAYQDKTSRPYQRTVYSRLQLDKKLRVFGGNEQGGEWKQSFSFSMPAAQELYYAFGYDHFKNEMDDLAAQFNFQTMRYHVNKTIVRDAQGEERVLFTDTKGKTLAMAKVGGTQQYEVISLIGDQRYVDIHLPAGCEGSLTFYGFPFHYIVYDLITEEQVADTSNLPAGFYRIEYISWDQNLNNGVYIDTANNTFRTWDSTPLGVKYNVNYYDYSLNYYNNLGQLKKNLQPNGFNSVALQGLSANPNHNTQLISEFDFDSMNQVVDKKSPDDGDVLFKYTDSGKIRFSQNNLQSTQGKFSYTNYDNLGRVIESGVCTTSNFAALNPEALNSFAGTRTEQNYVEYDYLQNPNDLSNIFGLNSAYHNPQFLSGKISKTYNKDKSGAIVSTTFYSYDVYGRISWTVQNINGVGAKTIDYEYDPVTSKVKRVIFQKHVSSEMFIHRYTYNSSEQLVKVETSTNGSSYTTHADYTFNAAGLTKRISIAEGIQGIDYVYNLNGQLKAINHPSLSSSKDPGGDSNDLFGMVIDYNDDDYSRDSDFNLTTPSGFNQYTGNVKAVTWNTQGIGSVGKMDTYYYGYNDQHWLEWAYKNTTPTSSANATGISFSSMSSGNYNVFGITYDPNGNIKTLSRNKNNDGLGNAMDRLTYHYEGGSSNQLDYVDDTVTFFTNADDIKDQTVDNYRYDALGQLKDDMYEGLSYEYTSTGRVSRIRKNGQIQVDFKYNERGQRVRKITYLNGFPSLNTYYIRDYAGNVVGVYENSAIKENPIYGLARLGIYNRPANTNFYQITDHLGTVRAVISKSGPNTAALVSAADNYPYGMTLPGREIIGGQPYRYAFQGQEKDPETGKEAFKLRLWDARLGRWLTPDPYGQFESPYMGMGNNPVSSIDPDGGFSSSFMAWVLNFLFFDLMGEVVEGQDGDWMIKKDGKEISDFKSLAKTFKYKKEDFFIHKSGFKYDKIKLKTPDTKHSLKDWSNASKGNKIEEAKKETYWGNSLSKVDTKILSLMKNVAMDADGTGLDSYFKRNPVSLSLGAFHYDEEYGELNITHGVDATIHKTIHYIGAIRDGSSSMKNKSEMSKRKVIANPVLEFGNLFLHTTSSNGNKISTLGN